MGIKGLLKLLKIGGQAKSLKEFSGQTVGVDALCWLHRASYCCAKDLVLGNPTQQYLPFCQHMIGLLQAHEIKPIVVFDGKELPMKLTTQDERRSRRDSNRQLAIEFMNQGDHGKALQYFRKSIKVSNKMIDEFINLLHENHVQVIVAPYEADSQLAYLFQQGITDFSISEDSDLMVFGASKVLYNLDKDGFGNFIDLEFIKTWNVPKDVPKNDANFLRNLARMSREQFINMSILAGCDYLDSPPGVGLKTAQTLIMKFKSLSVLLANVLAKKKKGKIADPEYKRKFAIAQEAFLHQPVYDTITQKVVTLNPLEEGRSLKIDLSFENHGCEPIPLSQMGGQFDSPILIKDDNDEEFIFEELDNNILSQNINIQQNFDHRNYSPAKVQQVSLSMNGIVPTELSFKRQKIAVKDPDHPDRLVPVSVRSSQSFIDKISNQADSGFLSLCSQFETSEQPGKRSGEAQEPPSSQQKLMRFLNK